MSEILDNHKDKISDILSNSIKQGSKISILSAIFSIYAFDSLKSELSQVESFKFLFTDPIPRKGSILVSGNDKRTNIGLKNESKFVNNLKQSQVARECAEWVRSKTEFKSAINSETIRSKLVIVNNDEDSTALVGSTEFSMKGLGFLPSKTYEVNVLDKSENATRDLLDWFENVWTDSSLVEDAKEEVLNTIEKYYKDNSPEFLYYVTLYNIFKEYLDETRLQDEITEGVGFKNTQVWNKLYKFQKDGVLGAISKIEKFNGCIIADSVGLGKTFEGLAVIKFYELRNSRVLVLCPKKLRENWLSYRNNDVYNPLAEDRFGFDVLNHSDLTRTSGKSGDIEIANINWGNYDLVVIDESHNFRNNDQGRKRRSRYSRLMNDIIKSGKKTKVLMLSATPVNNRLADLKNQIDIITEGDNAALSNEGIDNLQSTLAFAQKKFNQWLLLPSEKRTLNTLLEYLHADYFKILDLLTIARSRKHIEKYYDAAEVGKFPTRLRPQNIYSKIDLTGEFPTYEKVSSDIKKLKLSLYAPLQYVLPNKIEKYEKIYDIEVKGGSKFHQTDREKNLVGLMHVNMFKRLESSVKSYQLTLIRMRDSVKKTLDLIKKFEDFGVGKYDYDLSSAPESVDGDDDTMESMTIGGKVEVEMRDMDLIRWKEDLMNDLELFDVLLKQAELVTAINDSKLDQLKKVIGDKVRRRINDENNKILIFTAFADTASYLYENISKWAVEELGLNTALVTGGDSNKTNLKGIKLDLQSILIHFSPKSKNKDQCSPETIGVIDILIGTDCISEGQNLQDCDTLVNYDIHWNPVRIIQRFGRIDRIGSKNNKIKLINFWPSEDLDEYIKLEQRVRGRMILLNTSATGEEDIINESDKDVMNDIEFRKNQLTRLRDEVVDLEDISGNISITDFTMADYRLDLLEYLKRNEDDVVSSPSGIFAITNTSITSEKAPRGIIFTFRKKESVSSYNQNPIDPYYLIYIKDDGSVLYNQMQVKQILDLYGAIAKGNSLVDEDLAKAFSHEIQTNKGLEFYKDLLRMATDYIMGKNKEEGIKSIFSLGKTSIIDSESATQDDFELITYLVIK